MGLLRLLLAVAVVASHSNGVFGCRMIGGPEAVEIFFVISGFYMSLILRGKYAQHEHSTSLFYLNRFLRLYPTYLLCALLTWLVFFVEYAYLRRPPGNMWIPMYQAMSLREKMPWIFANWTMLGLDVPRWFHYRVGQGFIWFDQAGAFNQLSDGSTAGGAVLTIPQAWTIGLEIWFYLLAPFLLRRRWWVLAIVLTASLACKAYLTHIWHYETYVFFPAQCCYFVLGALLQQTYDHLRIANWPRIAGQIALLFLVGGVLTYGWFPSPAIRYVYYPAFWLGLPVIFGYTRKSILDRHMGNLSYPIYLVHSVVTNILHTFFKISNGGVITIVCVLVAVCIYIYLENPIDTFRHHLLSRNPPANAPAT